MLQLSLDVPEGWKNIVMKTIGFLDWTASGDRWQFIAKADMDSIWNFISILIGLRSLGNLEEISNIPSIFGFPISNLHTGIYVVGKAQNTDRLLLLKTYLSNLSGRRHTNCSLK